MRSVVSIVGRPNVGKSTLFNRILNEKLAVTSPISGVTRDRLIAVTEWDDKEFDLVDTGGIVFDYENSIEEGTLLQSRYAIENSDVIIFLVNGQEGLTGIDEQICDMLRKSKPHVILAVNKIDDFSKHSWDEFYQLGFEIIPISAEHGKNISDLMDEVAKNIPESGMDSFFDGIKVSLAGRPNAGKSSLFNKICGENRSIVSDIPHTTRDAIDTVIEYSGKKYKFVDTAGVRKKNKVNTKIERYSIIRSLRSIENSDVVLLLIDAELGIEEQDMRIANLALSNKKGLIIVINKWDLIEKDDKTYKKFLDDINNNAKFLSFVPVMFISALTGQRVHKIFENIDKVYANLRMKIPTSKLNDLIAEIKESYNMPSYKGNKLKLNFMTQINVDYPLFVIHTTRKELITPSFEKFLINRLRKKFDFSGVPIFINFKTKIKK